jgi:hypothetical protein
MFGGISPSITNINRLSGSIKSDPVVYHGDRKFLQLREVKRITLLENMIPISDAKTIAFFNNSEMIIGAKNVARLVRYDSQGKQLHVIGKWGNGPGEYGKPEVIKVFSDTLIVWDAQNHKYLFYDNRGSFIREEAGFQYALYDFAYYNNFIVSYTARKDQLVVARNLKTRRERYTGSGSVDHMALSLMHRPNYISNRNNMFYFTVCDKLQVHVFDISRSVMYSHSFNDRVFDYSGPLFSTMDAVQQSVTDRSIIATLASTSRVIGTFGLKDYLVVASEHGRVRQSLNEAIPEHRARTIRFNIFDYNMHHLDSVTINPSYYEEIGRYIVGCHNNSLYFISETTPDQGNSLSRVLYELKFQPIGR